MNYILTEEEYKVILAHNKQKDEEKEKKLQELCTLAAIHVPVPRPWAGKDAKPEPWGCILSPDSPGYCDDCPATEVCPYQFKEWSK
jgi:hypothetical protein